MADKTYPDADGSAMDAPRRIYVQYSDCGNHIRKWSREPFEGGVAYADVSQLRDVARNMRRYPFTSATMAEAAVLAANALEGIASGGRLPIPAGPEEV